MNNYEELVGIKTRFENSTEADLFTYLYSFENKWVLKNNKNINTIITKSLDNFGLNESYTFDELNINYKKCLYIIQMKGYFNKKRFTAEECLKHPYLETLYKKCQDQNICNDTFDWDFD